LARLDKGKTRELRRHMLSAMKRNTEKAAWAAAPELAEEYAANINTARVPPAAAVVAPEKVPLELKWADYQDRLHSVGPQKRVLTIWKRSNALSMAAAALQAKPETDPYWRCPKQHSPELRDRIARYRSALPGHDPVRVAAAAHSGEQSADAAASSDSVDKRSAGDDTQRSIQL
jgi:hypothetical protein